MANRSSSEGIVYHVVPDASAGRWVVSQESGGIRRELDARQMQKSLKKNRQGKHRAAW